MKVTFNQRSNVGRYKRSFDDLVSNVQMTMEKDRAIVRMFSA